MWEPSRAVRGRARRRRRVPFPPQSLTPARRDLKNLQNAWAGIASSPPAGAQGTPPPGPARPPTTMAHLFRISGGRSRISRAREVGGGGASRGRERFGALGGQEAKGFETRQFEPPNPALPASDIVSRVCSERRRDQLTLAQGILQPQMPPSPPPTSPQTALSERRTRSSGPHGESKFAVPRRAPQARPLCPLPLPWCGGGAGGVAPARAPLRPARQALTPPARAHPPAASVRRAPPQPERRGGAGRGGPPSS